MVERRRAISRLEENFVAARGRQPTAAELGSRTGLSAADIAQARAAAIKPVALEHDALESPGPIAVLADRNAPDPEAAALAAERSRALHAALWHLPPRQRHVVTRHFGLDAPESSLADLARDLGISERRVRAIEENALERLGRDLEPLS